MQQGIIKCYTITVIVWNAFDNISGGVCYFLWDREYEGKCEYFYHVNKKVYKREGFLDEYNINATIRDVMAYGIIDKIIDKEGMYFKDNSFYDIVSSRSCFMHNKNIFESSWKDYNLEKTDEFQYKYYVTKQTHGVPHGFISREQIAILNTVKANKLYILSYITSVWQIINKPS